MKRGTIFSGKMVPDGLHPNFHKLPKHLVVAEYSNKVNRINKIDRTYRIDKHQAKEKSVLDKFSFFKHRDCSNSSQLPSGLFGSLSDLRNTLNKVDFKKPPLLPTPKKLNHRCSSYSRALGRVQNVKTPSPEPPPNSRLRNT